MYLTRSVLRRGLRDIELERTWRIGRTRSSFMWNITTAAVIRSAVRTDHAQHVTFRPHADAPAAGVTRAGGPQSVCALPAVRAYNKAHARPMCRVLPTGSVETRRCTRSSFASIAAECPPRCISTSLALWPRKLVSLRRASTHRCLPAPCDLIPASIHLSSRPSPGGCVPRLAPCVQHSASRSFHRIVSRETALLPLVQRERTPHCAVDGRASAGIHLNPHPVQARERRTRGMCLPNAVV